MDKRAAALIHLLRPRHWVKNLFIFAGPFFSLKLFYPANALTLALGFACWCLITSAMYVFNDIVDRESDRQHPQKKNRPLPSGRISVAVAYVLWFALLLGSMLLAVRLGPGFAYGIILYFGINLVYSLYLKHVLILDVMCIAAGFVLRVLSGAVLIHVGFSEWLVMCAFMLSLLLGFGKRQEEITYLGKDAHSHRKVLKEYEQGFLERIPYALISATIVCYMLYTVSQEALRKFGTKNLIYTTPFVIYGLFRYAYVAYEKNKGADPTQVLFQDLPMVVNIVLWLLATGFIIYLK
ncbi:MAG: decaprenyl-phosphate phosphoribosyltransferase [Candidatus Omnitrophica bacterium]|nr:decaprenyl-phosphate phosphoribosyltransferase [Candidatus Omnitrophota bacterium]